jgi:serine/threonine protein kinase
MMTDFTDKAIPKLIDFGLTRILGPTQLTEESFGTIGYVAPEVIMK